MSLYIEYTSLMYARKRDAAIYLPWAAERWPHSPPRLTRRTAMRIIIALVNAERKFLETAFGEAAT